MLSREQAREQLKHYAIEDGDKRWQQGVAALPRSPRQVAQPLVDFVCAQGYTETQKRYKAYSAAVGGLADLSPDERARILAVLTGRLAPHVEQAWQLSASLPYLTSTAFRAPSAGQLHNDTRRGWLADVLSLTRCYDQDLEWYAAWAPYLGWGRVQSSLGTVFAAAIDARDRAGNAVFDILAASVRGEHEVGAFGSHVTRALLTASRADGWELMQGLLLAAQRQEGLRQAILEAVDLAHPQAFRRMLRVIVDHDLARFAATVRALDVWLGFRWDVEKTGQVTGTLLQLLHLLDHPEARAQALASDDAQANYLALWALAFQDAETAIPVAAELLSAARPERRFAGTHLLAELHLTTAYEHLVPMLRDDDLRVAARAVQAVQALAAGLVPELKVFDHLADALPRFPVKARELEPIVWDWARFTVDRSSVAALLIRHQEERSPRALIPYLDAMDVDGRANVAVQMAKLELHDHATLDALLNLAGDASHRVREQALRALGRLSVQPDHVSRLEALLTRTASDLRRGVIGLLLRQPDAGVLASADRLLVAASALQRQAGIELLGQMQQAHRQEAKCRSRLAAYRDTHTALPQAEERSLGVILDEPAAAASLVDALGLMDPTERTRPEPPRPQSELATVAHRPALVTPAAFALVHALDALVDANRTVPVTVVNRWETREELLGNLRWGFPDPKPVPGSDSTDPTLPLRELWETWWQDRPPAQRDDDGLELLRAWTLRGPRARWGAPQGHAAWTRSPFKILYGATEEVTLKYAKTVHDVITWLIYLHPPREGVEFLLDAVELTFALVPADELARSSDAEWRSGTWRGDERLLAWLQLAREHRTLCAAQWSDVQIGRLWRLLRWFDEPVVRERGLGVFRRETVKPISVRRDRPNLDELAAAYHAGAATAADVLDHLLGPRESDRWGRDFSALRMLTGRKGHPLFERVPELRGLVDRCRDRIIEIETHRGELPTEASAPVSSVRSVMGVDNLARLLGALGTAKLASGYAFDSLSKSAVLSHLVRVTFPGPSDTGESFVAAMQQVRVSQSRLLAVAVYAPQWAELIEQMLSWPGLSDAVWWLHAHTKDSFWHVDSEIRDIWQAEATERTPLTGADLIDGAVDVEWFLRVYRTLGEERWKALYQAAQPGAGGKGYTRARLVADAMLGRVNPEDLVARIKAKRNQDAVRVLGLVPLKDERERDVLDRYQVIQEFVRTGKVFGAMRRQSEKRAAAIGLENLARTAGYADPIRLEWAMEARAVADFAGGSKTVTLDDVSLTLAIDRTGNANLSVAKGGQALKAVPAKLKKDPRVVELANRKKELARQAARMRASLEQAMCRGDEFTDTELESFCDHPLLAPLMRQLLFTTGAATGYPADHGSALRSHDGSSTRVAPGTLLRLAHPHDLFTGGAWPEWQRECFRTERIQPFKQVFRELYPLTAAELAEQTQSRRYAGQQVQPRQALALFGQRGWVNHPEQGVRRVFHKEKLAAWVNFDQGWTTPAEVEGAKIEMVYFTRRGDVTPLPLQEVPPRVFSEAMRDLDLVVSVAHAGGVDPEASASTVEMRAALVAETSALLQLANVRVQGQHALVEGKLGSYSVHLGSAVVHRQPGGMLCIVAVPAQQRGRLFLPFVDDDPRTAEVLSKVILLARDAEIRDPVILQQLLA